MKKQRRKKSANRTLDEKALRYSKALLVHDIYKLIHDVTSALRELQGRADFLTRICTDKLNHAYSDDDLSVKAIKSCVGVLEKMSSSTLKKGFIYNATQKILDISPRICYNVSMIFGGRSAL